MTEHSEYRQLTDDNLVVSGRANESVEMMRRLKDAIGVQERTSTRLGAQIWWLNVWLLIFTVAIFGLTVVQIIVSMRGR